MSNVKPELYVRYGPRNDADSYWKATPADLIAHVRQAIESGEIEGRIIDNRLVAWPGEEGVGDGLFLIIPVSDGGSET